MSSVAAWVGAALFAIAALQPQSTATAGRIAGRVTDADGRAIERARVTVASDALAAPRSVLTDAQGRFSLDGLPPGHYSAAAVRTGYVPQPFGGATPATIDLTGGQQLSSIDFVLPPAGVITGRILDEDSGPLAGAIVSALRPTTDAGRRTWRAIVTTKSDDRGEFRLFPLGAGSYLVSASDPAFDRAAADPAAPAYSPTFFPGVVSTDAAREIVVDPAVAPARVEFRLHIVRPSQVSGRVTSWNRRELLSAAVIISPQDERPTSTAVSQARITADGGFTFSNVPAGRYLIRGSGVTKRDGASLSASFAVLVEGRDIGNVDLVLTPGGTMDGRVTARAKHGYPLPDLHALRVRVPLTDAALSGDTLTGAVAESGAFHLAGMVAGEHMLNVDGLRFPWRVEQAIVQGRDIASTVFDVDPKQEFRGVRIVLSDTAAGVSGVVTVPSPLMPGGVGVVVFPADPLKRRSLVTAVRHARLSSDNAYELSGLPAGDYLVAAIVGIADDEATDPAVLDSVAEIASPVRLTEAQIASLPLSARPMPRRAPSS